MSWYRAASASATPLAPLIAKVSQGVDRSGGTWDEFSSQSSRRAIHGPKKNHRPGYEQRIIWMDILDERRFGSRHCCFCCWRLSFAKCFSFSHRPTHLSLRIERSPENRFCPRVESNLTDRKSFVKLNLDWFVGLFSPQLLLFSRLRAERSKRRKWKLAHLVVIVLFHCVLLCAFRSSPPSRSVVGILSSEEQTAPGLNSSFFSE